MILLLFMGLLTFCTLIVLFGGLVSAILILLAWLSNLYQKNKK